MSLVSIKCPHCGGSVEMDDSLTFGSCSYCGNKVFNDKVIMGNVTVKMDRVGEVVNLLKLAEYAVYDRKAPDAAKYVDKAMAIHAENSDVWYLKALLETKNADEYIARARQYPSLGVFTDKDLVAYADFNCKEKYQGRLAGVAIISFFLLFISIPVGVVGTFAFGISNAWAIIPVVFVIAVVAFIATLRAAKHAETPLPKPAFEMPDEEFLIEEERAKQAQGGNSSIKGFASQGDPESQYKMGMACFMGVDGQEQSFGGAFGWFLRAAEQGHGGACYQVAQAYERGLGTNQDLQSAVQWYAKAANAGNIDAAKALERLKDAF